VLLDEVRFEEEGLADAAGEDVFQSLGALDHPDVSDVEGRAEIRSDAVAQNIGLAHIEDPTLAVLEEVDARRARERGDLRLERLAS